MKSLLIIAPCFFKAVTSQAVFPRPVPTATPFVTPTPSFGGNPTPTPSFGGNPRTTPSFGSNNRWTSNQTQVENINGTFFSFYLSGYPYFPSSVEPYNMCEIDRPDSCDYMGDNYCCGTWYIDNWYKSDLTRRITNRGYGDPFYAASYFNEYVGYQCEKNPQFYDHYYSTGDNFDASLVDILEGAYDSNYRSSHKAAGAYDSRYINSHPYDSRYMVFSCQDYQYADHYDFKECDPEDRMACRRYGREYCCATYHIAPDVANYYASTYSDSETSEIFGVKTGCEMSPSFYNFTQFIHEAYDIGFYTCQDDIWSYGTMTSVAAVSFVASVLSLF